MKIKEGDLIKIPYDIGLQTYGRILVEGSYAFYDYSSSEDIVEFKRILKSDILFTAQIEDVAIKSGDWVILTNIPLEENLKNFYPRYFNAVPTNNTNLGFYNVYKAEIERAIEKDWIKTGKIQLGGVFSKELIEKRLSDYYRGITNENNQRTISVFKKYLKIQ